MQAPVSVARSIIVSGLYFFNRPGHGIDKNQPAFGIGIADFNRFTGKGTHNITWTNGRSRGHVFHQGHDADHLDIRLKGCHGKHGTGNGRGSGHIHFHGFDAAGRLEVDSA